LLEMLDGLVHPVFGVQENVVGGDRTYPHIESYRSIVVRQRGW
jgi:hypothetical protein